MSEVRDSVGRQALGFGSEVDGSLGSGDPWFKPQQEGLHRTVNVFEGERATFGEHEIEPAVYVVTHGA
jgi:hypothetical protein